MQTRRPGRDQAPDDVAPSCPGRNCRRRDDVSDGAVSERIRWAPAPRTELAASGRALGTDEILDARSDHPAQRDGPWRGVACAPEWRARAGVARRAGRRDVRAHGAQNLYALDARTGRTLWHDQSGGSGSDGRHWGVALGDGLVFLPQRDTRMLALDQESGEIVWSHTLADANDPAPVRLSLASPPMLLIPVPPPKTYRRARSNHATIWRFSTSSLGS